MRAKSQVARIARDHLMATGNTAVRSGDVHLLHEIAEKAGIKSNSLYTERQVLRAIARNYEGILVRRYTGNRWRVGYWLPEYVNPQVSTLRVRK